MNAPTTELEARLTKAARDVMGQTVEVRNLKKMPGGHAGFTYGFDMYRDDGSYADRYILKMGPPGVRRVGVGDVFRQAQLLTSLHKAGIPVPPIVWAQENEDELGSPYIVMQWMAGSECFNLDSPDPPGAETLWTAATDTLAALAGFDWKLHLADWEAVTTLEAEFQKWKRTLHKAPEPEWIEMGLAARDALARNVPGDDPVGLIHGDFQLANLLVEDGRVTAIIDWDLACIGSRRLDLAWMLMFADREYWGDHWQGLFPRSLDSLVDRFQKATGEALDDLQWYRAFAGYRFGAISCLNVRLHRDGRRPDPVWDRLALDIPRLFGRAKLLAERYG